MSRTSVSAVIFRTIGFVESCQFEPFLKAFLIQWSLLESGQFETC